MMEQIDLLSPDESRPQTLRDMLLGIPAFTARSVLLFGGDRWSCVEVVVLLALNGVDAGMATLAPTDEMGQGGPTIVALWIDPEISEAAQLSTLQGADLTFDGVVVWQW